MRCLCLLLICVGADRSDTVDTVEINTFGEQPRTALIYREADGTIRDWRWYSEAAVPVKVRPGLWLAVWRDQGKIRAVEATAVRWTRTLDDVELIERRKLPEAQRRKLAP